MSIRQRALYRCRLPTGFDLYTSRLERGYERRAGRQREPTPKLSLRFLKAAGVCENLREIVPYRCIAGRKSGGP